MDGADSRYLDWLAASRVTIGRPTSTTSLVVDHDGKRCLVAFTATEPMVSWWRARSTKSLRTANLPVSDLATRWGAPGVDLLVDPGTPQQAYVPIAALRAHLGLGPVVADGEGDEPLAFAGFSGGTYLATRSLTLVVVAVLASVFGLVIGSLALAGIGLGFLALALLLARQTILEVRAAARARRRPQAAGGPA